MAHEARGDPREEKPATSINLRAQAGRLAALFGACAVAIAQPVLSAFGKSPETFIYHHAEGIDLVLFALAIVAVPPLALWSLGMLVPRATRPVHAATVGGLIALAIAPAVSGLSLPLVVLGSAAVGIGVWVLTIRAAPFRLWSQLLGGLAVFALFQFLAVSPASDTLDGGSFEPVAPSDSATPIVLIVLDELPTASVITPSGGFDEVRFPNLARFAGEATWYRNHTTRSGFTETAVPSVFTGKDPDDVAPVFTNHPDSIFRLLAGSHDLVVSEAMTRLCPTSVCGDKPVAPTTTEAAEPVEVGADMGALFKEAIDLWFDRLAGSGGAPALDDFQEDLEATSTVASVPEPFGEDDGGELLGWKGAALTQPTRLTEFLAALQPGDHPLGAVIHLVSPHYPWRHLPDDRIYAEPISHVAFTNDPGIDWIDMVERQRHLLQASYTDRLVGQILARIEALGVYDQAAIAIVADHGISFSVGDDRRTPWEPTLSEVMWSPLLIKAPGQSEGRVDDSNMQIVDVVPTLADLAGIDIPWEVDGAAAGSEEIRARGTVKPFRRFALHDLDVDGEAGFAEMLGRAFPALGAGDDPVRALYTLVERGDLVGQEYRPSTTVASDSITIDNLDRLRESDEPVLALSGFVDAGGRDVDHVVAAIDGRIVAVSPLIARDDGDRDGYLLLLPAAQPVELANVRLGLVEGSSVRDAGLIAA